VTYCSDSGRQHPVERDRNREREPAASSLTVSDVAEPDPRPEHPLEQGPGL
jgi:hypothetical protein